MKKLEFNNIEELINNMANLASESAIYEKLAYYIEQNYLGIIFMTAEETAKNARVSQGSVSRFCMALGYKGYNDFLRNLQKVVSEKITAPQRYMFTTSSGKQSSEIIKKEAQNIVALSEILQGELYEEMIDAIVNSEKIILLSARMSATLLPYMKYILDKMRDNVEIILPESPEWDRFFLKDPKKVTIITICFPRYSRVLLEKLKEVKESGFNIYAITDRRLSPTVQVGLKSIFVPITVSSIFDLYSTPMAFINLMLKDASKKIPSLDKRLEIIENYDEKNQAFYKRNN